jgi:hypothetical protein
LLYKNNFYTFVKIVNYEGKTGIYTKK